MVGKIESTAKASLPQVGIVEVRVRQVSVVEASLRQVSLPEVPIPLDIFRRHALVVWIL